MKKINLVNCNIEIKYTKMSRLFIKKTFKYKIPYELILEIIKYISYNCIKLNKSNLDFEIKITKHMYWYKKTNKNKQDQQLLT